MSIIEKKIAHKLKNLSLLMRENDVLTRQLSKCGRNVKKARDYIMKSKSSYDKYKNYSKFSSTVQKEILKKLEEFEKGNDKIKLMLNQKLKQIQKNTKVNVNELNNIKPLIKKSAREVQLEKQQQNNNNQNENILSQNVTSKLTFREVQSMKDNQLNFRSNAARDKKIRYRQEIQKTQQDVSGYQNLLMELQLSKLDTSQQNKYSIKKNKKIYMQDFYDDLYTVFNIPLSQQLSLQNQSDYLDSVKRMYYRNKSILELSKQKLQQMKID